LNYAGKFGSGELDPFSGADIGLGPLLSPRGHLSSPGKFHVDKVSTHAPSDAIIISDAHLLFTGDFKRSGVDLVLTVGGDGTLLAASHQVGPDVPILGVNSAPESSVGFFCAASKGSVLETLRAAFEGTLRRTQLARMRVDLNDTCLHKRVLNEALFCHGCPAATTRYILRLSSASGEVIEEEQRSSGLWIGPAAGSTAAQRSAGGKVLPLASTKLQFVVREAYVRLGGSLRLPTGLVEEGGSVAIHCKIREGKAFLDGLHIVHDVTIGDRLVLRRSDETLTVLGLTRRNGGS